MTIKLSKRMSLLKPSASLAAMQKVAELKSAGRTIIDLTLGEPDQDTPANIVDAAIAAMHSGKTHYTATAGTIELRKAIAEKFTRDNKLDFSPGEIVVANGAKQLIFEAFAATLDQGDEVIIPAPYWVSYPDIVTVNGGVPVIVPCSGGSGFKLTASQLNAAINVKTRWVVLNSPNNPTGAVYSRAEMQALVDVLQQHPNVAIMTDDIYEHLIYGDATHVTPLALQPGLKERCLLINGVSKAYAMTGWRLGYAAGSQPLVAAIIKLLGQKTTCASSISQAAATEALAGDQEVVHKMVSLYHQRRNRMVELLNTVQGMTCSAPDGAFYLFPSVEKLLGQKTPAGSVLQTDTDVAAYFLEAANVAVMDGSSYGLSPYLRLSFATSMEAIESGCEAIATACQQLVPSTHANS